jgi:hypothetical protein
MRFRKKSGGMPALPTSRFLDWRNRFSLKAPAAPMNLDTDPYSYQMT